MINEYAPIFVLSTGRAATVTLTHLLNLCPDIYAVHEPEPDFSEYVSGFYGHQGNLNSVSDKLKARFYETRFAASYSAAKKGKQYVEVNPYIPYPSFYREAFPQCKFVLLHRNPYDFIHSGLRREWYKEDCDFPYILEPREEERTKLQWESMEREQKIAWFWNELNGIFLHGMEDDGNLLGFEEMIEPGIILWNYFVELGERPPQDEIEDVLKMKLNASRGPNTQFIFEDVNPYLHLASRLGYTLERKELEVVT